MNSRLEACIQFIVEFHDMVEKPTLYNLKTLKRDQMSKLTRYTSNSIEYFLRVSFSHPEAYAQVVQMDFRQFLDVVCEAGDLFMSYISMVPTVDQVRFTQMFHSSLSCDLETGEEMRKQNILSAKDLQPLPPSLSKKTQLRR